MDLRRRRFLLRAIGAAGLLAGCREPRGPAPFTCTDTGGLPEADVAARASVGYADRTTDPERACDACQQYLASAEGCGGCRVLRGPIHPRGTCRVFTKRG